VLVHHECFHRRASGTAIVIAPDDSTIVIGSQAGISLLSLPDLAVVKTLPTQLTHVHDLVYLPNGQMLFAAGDFGVKRIDLR